MTTERRAILDGIRSLSEELSARKKEPGQPVGLDRFILLLGGISSYRRVPGVESAPCFDEVLPCRTPEDAQSARAHLEEMFGITDLGSLLEASDRLFSCGREYAQFITFWNGAPSFNETELPPPAKAAFTVCKNYARIFYDTVGEQGFYAWDIGERVGLLRHACACGVITPQDLRAVGWELAHLATDVYASWEEYALSALCGSVYFMFVQNGRLEGNLRSFFELNRKLIRRLFVEERHWATNAWYAFPQKIFAKAAADMRPLLPDWDGPDGCLATDRILVDGEPVGYCYREQPSEKVSHDSGWRFFAGTEDEDYLSNPENAGVYTLNTLCNYCPDVAGILASPYGTAYFRDDSGTLVKE